MTQDIIACDFSFRRPGFALLRYDPDSRKVSVQETSNINNKTEKKKCDGQILSEIAHELRRYFTANPNAVIVREQALDKQGGPRNSRVIEVLHKVVGVSDLYAWAFNNRQFAEIHPKTIKKMVANDQLAEKDAVASALTQFVGDHEYACDDESDAVAVGVAWLLREGMIENPYLEEQKK